MAAELPNEKVGRVIREVTKLKLADYTDNKGSGSPPPIQSINILDYTVP